MMLLQENALAFDTARPFISYAEKGRAAALAALLRVTEGEREGGGRGVAGSKRDGDMMTEGELASCLCAESYTMLFAN